MPKSEPNQQQKLFLKEYDVLIPPSEAGAASLIRYIQSGADESEQRSRAALLRQVQDEWQGALVEHRVADEDEREDVRHPQERVLYVLVRSASQRANEKRGVTELVRRGHEPFIPSLFKAVLDRKGHPAVGIEKLKIVRSG